MQIKSKVWLEKDGELVFGSGKLRILKAILGTGSINKAAKRLGMSYRHAWSHCISAEKRIGQPLLIRNKGGKDGGGAILTDYARGLLKKFEKLEHEVNVFTDKRYRAIFSK
ncbi:MAG: winged helix-turn-helix domain-containing protein [Candidatus Omnitrophota bacterium]|nr:winged helix-turn-helix domain-containing protein [Candidatus Omnitrophota bacterium]